MLRGDRSAVLGGRIGDIQVVLNTFIGASSVYFLILHSANSCTRQLSLRLPVVTLTFQATEGDRMKVSLRVLCLLPCMALDLAVSTVAHATTYSVSGEAWEGGTTGNVPVAGSSVYSTAPTASFTLTNSVSATDLFNFYSSTDNGLSSFLTTNPSSTGNGDTLSYITGASHANDSIDNDLFQFTGTTTLADGTYTFSHDDGLLLYLNGVLVVNNGGPTSAETTDLVICSSGSSCVNNNNCQTSASTCMYDFAGGTVGFTLDYAEVDGAPAQLVTDLALTGPPPTVTPEPNSLMLLGTGVLAAAGMVRRRIFA
jgi:hypothetical protein